MVITRACCIWGGKTKWLLHDHSGQFGQIEYKANNYNYLLDIWSKFYIILFKKSGIYKNRGKN